jgi:hypothetical protein
MRIATFNLENLDDETGQDPSLATRVAIMRPQLERIAADILCLQEVHSQDSPEGRTLGALDTLLAGTRYESYERLTTKTTAGQLYQERNLMILSRFPFIAHARQIIRDSSGPRPSYRVATADPPDQTADPLEWERPILYAQVDLGDGPLLHVLNLHLKGTVASAATASKQRDCRYENPPPSPCSRYAVRLCRLPLPTRCDRPRGPLVPALLPVLPRRRGAARRARDRGRPRHDLPLGAAVHAAAGRRRPAVPARLSREFPKPLTDEFVKAADAVITMGCGDACPIYPGKRDEDWELQDPAGQPVEVVRRIRDDIDARLQQLLNELVPASA